jgi:hypothetical protein
MSTSRRVSDQESGPASPLTPPVPIRTPPSDTNEELSGRAWAHQVPQDPWDPAILTLDGGGIRGYASLLMLQALMHEIADWEQRLAEEEGVIGDGEDVTREDDLQPCLYFDFMYGTSTGGLIATLLGRLRLTVPQCLEIYREVGNDLFGTKRSFMPFATRYDHTPLEEAVKKIVKKFSYKHGHTECDGEDWNPWYMEEGWEEGGPTGRICQT